jgi:superfamily II DNA or RNA helicase|tara:strand:- start:11275 stop:12750 length:1476 start_codon:yes stop_codon:yes gene_type:complete
MAEDDIATYIGNKGYTIYKENISVEEQQALRKELNVKPFVPKSSLIKPQPFPVYRESKKKLYIPRFYGLEIYGEPDDSLISEGVKINLKFKGELRKKQKPVVDKYMKHIKTKSSGLLALHTGFGKTCLALNIISRLNLKTIIIVHKEFLLRQWIERIEQFLPDAKVGKIQAKTVDTEGKDIVICMLQSLSMKDYPKDMFKEYGFMIVDEVHHLGAEVFSRAFYKVVTKYALGLSATIKRKDGLTKVIKWFLGDVVCKIERKGEDNVLVKVINYETTDEEFNNVLLNFRGQVNYTGMIKKICEFNRRSEFILKILSDLLKENPNQQIMILGHQKKLLQYLHDAIRHRTIATVGYYVGGMKEKDLKISEGKKVIIATYAMAEEGLDIKTLTTLIMATPKVDVRQSVGRILRQKHKQAIVVDIVDPHMLFQRHFGKRRTFYKKSKFKVMQTNMTGYQNGNWETIYDPINNIKKSFSKSTKKEDKLLQGVCLIND